MNTLKNALIMAGVCVSVVACHGDSGSKPNNLGAPNGDDSVVYDSTYNLPVGACEVTNQGNTTLFTENANKEVFIYALGHNETSNNKTALGLSYTAMYNNQQVLDGWGTSENGPKDGFCSLLRFDNMGLLQSELLII